MDNSTIRDAEIHHVSDENVWKDRKHHLWFPISFTSYKIEHGRLYLSTGLFSSREDECLLYRVLDISLTRNFFQMIFGTGTIELTTRDQSTPIIRLENIKKPKMVKRYLSDLIEQERINKRVVGKDMYGASNHHDTDFDMDGIPDHME